MHFFIQFFVFVKKCKKKKILLTNFVLNAIFILDMLGREPFKTANSSKSACLLVELASSGTIPPPPPP
ncbi:MAG: hypothetical protein FWG66_04355, partial [Spirochaetes bacterium]|nr:hypothetical protein [Spirochaetota bacterium]